MARGWRVYYADGATCDSAAQRWRDLPNTGVIGVVVFEEPPYRRIVDGGDWYYLDEDGEPSCTDTADRWGEWAPLPFAPTETIKRGAAVTDERFETVKTRMVEDKAWP